MKQFILSLLIFCFTLLISEAQNNIARIGFVNPTVRNIEKIVYFKEHGFFKFDSLLLTGYFHAANATEIEKSEQYLTDQHIDFVNIKTIQGKVSTDSLFMPNKWSPQFEEIFKTSNALIFFGGNDIPPSIYGENTFITTNIIERVRNWEISFMFHLIGGSQNQKVTPLLKQNPDFTITGICLGMQIMNIAAGGSLFQDIPAQIYGVEYCEEIATLPTHQQHKNYLYGINNNDDKTSYIAFHPISIADKSFLKALDYSDNICVPSVHHQAVKQLGQNLKKTATSKDGKVVEAVEHTKYKNVYGIQFHIDFPELYAPDATFQIASKKYFLPSEKEKMFYKSIWSDFSNRINNSLLR
jgi:putative glutamine amidotransferase